MALWAPPTRLKQIIVPKRIRAHQPTLEEQFIPEQEADPEETKHVRSNAAKVPFRVVPGEASRSGGTGTAGQWCDPGTKETPTNHWPRHLGFRYILDSIPDNKPGSHRLLILTVDVWPSDARPRRAKTHPF